VVLFADATGRAGAVSTGPAQSARMTPNKSIESSITVFDSDVETTRSKTALLGITTPSRNSFSFRLEEWLSLIDLWTKAVKAQSDSWKVVGSMTETETFDVCHLTVSAGPGVMIVISSPKKGAATYLLSKDDMAGFEKALYGVKDFLSH
jgi:hypothetical protein